VEAALSVVGVAVLAFVATNLDNLMLLVGIASRVGQPFASIVAGALLASVVTLCLGVSAALATDLAPQRWLGLLGVVPIALGLRELTRLVRSRAQQGDAPRADAPPLGALGLAGLLVANSTDSIAALVPLFAETREALLPPVAVAILAVTLLGCGIARWIASHARFGPPLRRSARLLVPIVLIAVGVYILANTRGDTVPDAPAEIAAVRARPSHG
jgi:cadmium resistance protein CadD (predicted permease)